MGHFAVPMGPAIQVASWFLEKGRSAPVFETGLPGLDRILGGGLPAGLVELTGGRSSGRFALGLSVLAAATRQGESAALVDLADQLDPENALATGIDLGRLLWLRSPDLKTALIAAEMVLQTGFRLVVMDLAGPIGRHRISDAAWIRLARAARTQKSVLFLSSPARLAGSAATAVLRLERTRPIWTGAAGAPRLLAGLSARLTLVSRRGHCPSAAESLDLTL